MRNSFILVLFLTVSVWGNAWAQETVSVSSTQHGASGVRGFTSELRIRADAVVEVKERIDYNFGPGEWHGIVRDIPVKYEAEDGIRDLRIFGLLVEDEQGTPYPFITGFLDNYFRIIIGDPAISVTGDKFYIVRYKVDHAMSFFPDHDELYWHVTGNNWKVPLATTTATVILPKNIRSSEIRRECFVGFFSDRQRCRSTDAERSGDTASAILFTETSLAVGEGLTISVGIPKGIVKQETIIGYLTDLMRIYAFVSLSIALALGSVSCLVVALSTQFKNT